MRSLGDAFVPKRQRNDVCGVMHSKHRGRCWHTWEWWHWHNRNETRRDLLWCWESQEVVFRQEIVPVEGYRTQRCAHTYPCAQTHSLNKKAECEMNWQGSSTVIVSNGNGKYHGTLLYIYILRVLNDCMFINYEIYMVF